MSRYTIDHETWQVEQVKGGETPEGIPFKVQVSTAELTDTRTGRRYPAGAYAVEVLTSHRPKPRKRTFIGETAWSQAQYLAEDHAFALLRGR